MNELVPKIKPLAPKSLKNNVINQIKKENQMKAFNFKRVVAVAAVLIAIVALPLIFSSNAQARAMNLLSESIGKMTELKTMVMKYLVRTEPNDNFDYININSNFVEHTISEQFGNPSIFRIEKPQRVAVFEGKKSLLWIKSTNEAKITDGMAGIYGELNVLLLEPRTLLENAQKAAKSKGAKVNLQEKNDKIILTIEAKAQGDFSQSDYLLNSSITESDNLQTYVFDKTTKLLQSLEIAVLNNKNYITVLKTTSIEYNIPIDKNTLVELPQNLIFKSLSIETDNSNLKNISAKQAIEKLLNAFQNRDISQVKEMIACYPVEQMKQTFYGLEILSIGESFKSGAYPGEFVPVKVKLSDGSVKSTNLAVRNDNPNKIWILDGGI